MLRDAAVVGELFPPAQVAPPKKYFAAAFSRAAEEWHLERLLPSALLPSASFLSYLDGFYQWCKQVVGLCLTDFLQATILIAVLSLFSEHALLGLGLMLSAGEIPRIAGVSGLDTSTRENLSSAVYTAQTAINITKTVARAAAA